MQRCLENILGKCSIIKEATWIRSKSIDQGAKLHADYYFLRSFTRIISQLSESQSDSNVDIDVDEINCQVCHLGDKDSQLLLCDLCNQGYHTKCVKLSSLPNTTEWHCDACSDAPIGLFTCWISLVMTLHARSHYNYNYTAMNMNMNLVRVCVIIQHIYLFAYDVLDCDVYRVSLVILTAAWQYYLAHTNCPISTAQSSIQQPNTSLLYLVRSLRHDHNVMISPPTPLTSPQETWCYSTSNCYISPLITPTSSIDSASIHE